MTTTEEQRIANLEHVASRIAEDVTETINIHYGGKAHDSEIRMEIEERLKFAPCVSMYGVDKDDPELISEIMFWVSCETY